MLFSNWQVLASIGGNSDLDTGYETANKIARQSSCFTNLEETSLKKTIHLRETLIKCARQGGPPSASIAPEIACCMRHLKGDRVLKPGIMNVTVCTEGFDVLSCKS